MLSIIPIFFLEGSARLAYSDSASHRLIERWIENPKNVGRPIRRMGQRKDVSFLSRRVFFLCLTQKTEERAGI